VGEKLRRRNWIAPLVLLAAAAGVAWLQARIPAPKRADLGAAWVPRPDVAKLASFGFHTAMSDFYWLQAVQVVGATVKPESKGTLLGRYIDVVTTLDPWVDHPYRFAAVWLTGSEADVRQADRLLLRSMPYHPKEWRNRFYLGFNLFYYLGENEDAAGWVEKAAFLPGAPSYLIGLAAKLRAGQNLDVAENMILEMLRSTKDPKRRARYEDMLDRIGTERRARVLDQARAVYKKIHGRDIRSVADLLRGPDPILRALPREPHGGEWIIDKKTGRIVSTYYGMRWELHSPGPAERRFMYGWASKASEAPQEGTSTSEGGASR
jgi:hypothetical protein